MRIMLYNLLWRLIMFGKKEKIEKSSQEIIEDVVSPAPIPFLEREKPITDLNSLCDRIKALNNCIDQCKKDIYWAEYKLGKDSNIDNRVGVWELLTEEELKNVDDIIRKRLQSYIGQQKDLIHTCQDELDWLQMKIGMGSPVLKNKFESGDFNFDPYKDHC